MLQSEISWTDNTFNPVMGCTMIAPECANCYAASLSARFGAKGNGPYAGLAQMSGVRKLPQWTGEISLRPGVLDEMVRKLVKKQASTRNFLCSMGDLGHVAVPTAFIDEVFGAMALLPQHAFQVLTKRPERLAAYTNDPLVEERVRACAERRIEALVAQRGYRGLTWAAGWPGWPLPNVWLGTSAGTAGTAGSGVPHLRAASAALRFVSCEPMLEGFSLQNHLEGIDWVIFGGESGARARPLDPIWLERGLADALAAGTAPFVKQLGTVWARENGLRDAAADPSRWPEVLRVQEFPIWTPGDAPIVLPFRRKLPLSVGSPGAATP